MIYLCFTVFVLLSVVVSAFAQPEDCPAIVQEALQLAQEYCETTGTNEVCYGYLILQAAPFAGVGDDFTFDNPGDIENLSAVQTLQLSPMDVESGTWGVALMSVEALLQQTESENVTFVVFGDTEVTNPVQILVVEALTAVNIRRRPSEDAFIFKSFDAGAKLFANGRSFNGEWIRVRFAGAGENVGWVAASLLTRQDELPNLRPIDPDAEEVTQETGYGPMQVFYLQSGQDDAPCTQAPNSGVLIQTPEGEAEINLLVNEVSINLRATAYFQAQPGGEMAVYVVDGQATVEAEGVSHILVPGTSLSVPLDENGLADGPPSEPEPYDAQQVAALPTQLLNNPVAVPPPLEVAEGAVVSGEWRFDWLVREATCPDGQIVQFSTEDSSTSIQVAEDGSSMTILLTRYNRIETGVYQAIFIDSQTNTHRYTLRVQSLDYIVGEGSITYQDYDDCTLVVPFELRLVDGS